MSAPAPSMYSPAAQEVAQQIGLKLGRPNLVEFSETLQRLAKTDRDILAVTSDSRGSGKLGPFAEAFPQQIVEVGIAEQNLVGIAAGLGSCGKKSFAVSPACFLTTRALEQIKNDICYSDISANVIGISAGVSYGALGSTHHSLHDFAALRAIHNITVVAPADNYEARHTIEAAAKAPHPVYVRFGKAALYDLPRTAGTFEFGKADVIREGSDLAFIATGEAVIHCLLAAAKLEEQGMQCRVVSMHTVKPLDEETILSAVRDCGAIITAEEHSIFGGLGEACAATVLQSGLAPAFHIVGIPDEDTVTGSQSDIFRHYGISMEGLTKAANNLVERLQK